MRRAARRSRRSRKEGLFKVNTENVAQNEEDSKRDI
jgi:hypothetical protein